MRYRYIHPSFWQNPRYPEFGGFGSTIDDGIAHLRISIQSNTGPNINNFGGAIQALQSAGSEAVSQLGPAIDALSGGSPDVMQITHWAWNKNSVLASIPISETGSAIDTSEGAGFQHSITPSENLTAAAAAAKQMLDWYSQAYRLAQSKHFVAPQLHLSPQGHPAYSAPIPKLPQLPPEPIVQKSFWQKVMDWLTS